MSFHHGEEYIIVVNVSDSSPKEVLITCYHKDIDYGDKKMYLTSSGGISDHPVDSGKFKVDEIKDKVEDLNSKLLFLRTH